MMLISLYTSRVILRALGETDFGIYNVVGGVIVLFTFINRAMTASTQRYLNYSMGKGQSSNLSHVFSQALIAHSFIAILIVILGETVGLWIVETKLNIPPDRVTAAHWVYQLSIITSVLSIMRCPYNASIIAYEKMSFYAWVSIIESILKLGVALLIQIEVSDRLITYALLLTAVSFVITILYYAYCIRSFSAIRFKYKRDNKLLKEMSLFSTWSLLGNAANVGVNQGASIILNIFFGVIINASMGIANQINAVAGSFVSNFQTAFMPQITKSYASKDYNYLRNLILNSSRYSYLLLFIVSVPIYFNCEYILEIWLENVPPYTAGLTRVIIISMMFNALSGPLWMAVHAKGQIRNYQICISAITISILLAMYLAAKAECGPVMVFATQIGLLFVLFLYRLFYLNTVIKISVLQWINNVIWRIFVITLLIYSLSFLTKYLPHPLLRLLVDGTLGIILAFTIGLNSAERTKVIRATREFFSKAT